MTEVAYILAFVTCSLACNLKLDLDNALLQSNMTINQSDVISDLRHCRLYYCQIMRFYMAIPSGQPAATSKQGLTDHRTVVVGQHRNRRTNKKAEIRSNNNSFIFI